MSSPDPNLITIVPPGGGGSMSINVTINVTKYGQKGLSAPFGLTGCLLNVTLVTSAGFPTVGQTFDIIVATNLAGSATPNSPLPFPFTQSIVPYGAYKAFRLTYTG